jgi:acyl-CoA reductase-like NAD-dependent aldehyde dehydrogenase
VQKAADGVCFGAFHNAGQACLAIKRVYVEESAYDKFCDAVAQRVQTMVVGDGMQPGTTIGPLQNEVQFSKARHYLDIARQDGKVIAGGAVIDGSGYFPFSPVAFPWTPTLCGAWSSRRSGRKRT